MTGVVLYGGTLALIAVVFSSYIPRLFRVSRRHPRVRRLVWVWTAQCILTGFAASGVLTGLAPWAPWAAVIGVVGLGLATLVSSRRRIWHVMRHPGAPYPDDAHDD